MKIGVISDIHGNSPALEVVLPQLLKDMDLVLFLGDLCGYYPFVEECMCLWDQSSIQGVRGNHDQIFLDCLKQGGVPDDEYRSRYGSSLHRIQQSITPETVSMLDQLPDKLDLELSGVTLSLFHGAPWDPLHGRVYPDFHDWERFRSVNSDLILMGHTHHPFTKRLGDQIIVNPGSVGQPRDRSGAACFATIELETGLVEHHRAPFDASRLIQDARKHDPDVHYLTEVLTR